MVDGGMSLGFHTKEVDAEEKLQILNFFNQTGWLMFSEDQIQDTEIPTKDSDFDGKTPSQRLRGVLFVLWKRLGQKGDFEQFYKEKMEAFINLIKNKLDQ